MKCFRIWLLMVCGFLLAGQSYAQVNSEAVLVNRLLISLAKEDDSLYGTLQPKFDMLWKQAMNVRDTGEVATRRIMNIRSNPRKLQQYDPQFNPGIIKDFTTIHKKGMDSGLHWGDVLLVRYELDKQLIPREMAGLEKVTTARLQGYIFVQDLLTRKTFTLVVKDIFSVNGKWYGGHLVNVLEADNIPDYVEKLVAERRYEKQLVREIVYGDWDSIRIKNQAIKGATAKKADSTDEDEDKIKKRTDILERKLYTGVFDKDIPVELYVRSLKGNCPEVVCAWEAIYKFGDIEDYLKLDVSKSSDGKWVFTEEDVGVMELVQMGDKYTGTWTSFKDRTEYECVLTEKKEVKNRKLFMLDDIIENEAYANP